MERKSAGLAGEKKGKGMRRTRDWLRGSLLRRARAREETAREPGGRARALEGRGAILDNIKLAQLVRARDFQSRGRRFDSGKTPKTRELKST